MNQVLQEVSNIGIVPVIALNDVKDAEPLAKALIAGGLNCAEVTFRTDAAEESIRIMAEKFPEMLVGAGTVLTEDQADRAMAAGAKFLVSPGLNPKILAYCVEKGYPMIPGTANPSDVEQAIQMGLEVVKFFPAEQAGGINMIKAMCGPYTKLKFMPTGGINAANLNNYLSFDKIIACGGTWMCKNNLIESGQFDEIERLSKEAVVNMLGFELKHIGVNAENAEEAERTADMFQAMFGFHKKVGNSSVFAGTEVEVMKTPGRGTHGHIAVATNSVDRAVYHLSKQGFEFDMDSAAYDDKGAMKVIYFKNEVNGFAVHLVRK